jgi:hypothetical protein
MRLPDKGSKMREPRCKRLEGPQSSPGLVPENECTTCPMRRKRSAVYRKRGDLIQNRSLERSARLPDAHAPRTHP